MSFEGQQVVVVGASAGIGEATARAFAAAGADVVIAGRAKDRLDAARERIGFPVDAHQLDATDAAAVAAFFDGLGQISHLVLTASPGAAGAGPFAALEESALRAAFDGKFYAHVKVLQAAVPKMTQDGSITLVSAISARMALLGSAALAAVNGALESMTRPLAVELAPIRVNAVSPGIIDTHWWDALPQPQREATFQAAADSSPVGRIGKPEDVADAVLFLAGQGFMTGTVLEVAGGAHLATGR